MVVREIADPRQRLDISFKIVVKSAHLHKACKDAMGEILGLSWNSDAVEVSRMTGLVTHIIY